MGNEATNIKCYPAAYDIKGLIAVGSVTEARKRSAFSTYGAWQDVAAPGSAIMSTVSGGYAFMSGTSMATPVVSGICALYISQHLGDTPDNVEKAIKAATTGGIVDAAKLFSTNKEIPEIYVSGMSGTTAPYGARLYVRGNLDGDDLVYTLDGKTPVVKDGVVTVGQLYTGSFQITEDNGFTVGKKVTVKAIRVSGLGVPSKVASKTFTVGYANPTGVSIVNPPAYLVAGKSVTLSAAVTPIQADQKAVTWSLVSAPAGVSIDAKTGLLKTTDTGVNGTITVRVTTNTNGKSATASFDMKHINPVKKLVLNSASMVFELSTSAPTQRVSATAYDAGGVTVSPVTYSYSSSNTKVATVDKNGYVTAVGKGSAVITVKAQDGSNVTAKCSVTVKQLVTALYIDGLQYVAPGKTATYKASVYPANANSKAVVWTVDYNSYGITMTSAGKLSVPSGTPNTAVRVHAYAQDGSGVSDSLYVNIRPLATYISNIGWTSSFGGGGITWNKNGSVNQFTLYSVESAYWWGDEKTWDDASIQLTASTDAAAPIVWTSSNPKVAGVDSSGYVWAVSAGTATITAKVADASGKKVSVKVRVINPASGVTVTSAGILDDDNFKFLAVGKSVKNTASLGDAFGKPSITKVTWDWSVTVYDRNGNEDGNLENLIRNKKWITISAAGVLTAKAGLKDYVDDYTIYVTVTASTTDATYLSGNLTYMIVPLTSKIQLAGRSSVSVTMPVGNYTTTFYIYTYYGKSGYYSNYSWCGFNVKSSNPNVAAGVIEYDKDGDAYLRVITGMKKGTATITVTAADGSGKKATARITVK